MMAHRISLVLSLLLLLSITAFAQSDSAPPTAPPAAVAEKPEADKPPADKPEADKPASDKTASDKPASDKAAPEKPVADNSVEKTGESARSARSDNSYLIGANDILAVSVWKEPDISRSVPVRSDGKISLPLAGELQAAGQTPRQLEQEITKRLQNYISEPEVTVMVTDSKSQKVNILGMVSRPGAYLLTGSTTVLDAIAMAGGFKDFAKQKAIYVLRTAPDGSEKRMPFNYKDVIKGKNADENIHLLAGDTVVVP
ncbi:MAG: polysaccharide biosynthesis/export family protein [Terriglobales bacterium]|jgi:polysaccharide export outer membrane protein